MNSFLDFLFTFLFFVPGGLQFAILLVSWLVITAYHRRFQAQHLALALRFTGAALALTTIAEFRPYFLALHIGIFCIAQLALRRGTRWQLASVPLAFLLYGLGFHQLTIVERRYSVQAQWSIGERAKPGSGYPEQLEVKFHYGRENDHTEHLYSDQLAKQLREKGSKEAMLTFRLNYSMGKLAATGLDSVNGVEVPPGSGGGSGCSKFCGESPFPSYYFGWKGFR
jgi:hypothetical protein